MSLFDIATIVGAVVILAAIIAILSVLVNGARGKETKHSAAIVITAFIAIVGAVLFMIYANKKQISEISPDAFYNSQPSDKGAHDEISPNSFTAHFDDGSWALFQKATEISSVAYACASDFATTDAVRILAIVKYLLDSGIEDFNIAFSTSKDEANMLSYQNGVEDKLSFLSETWQREAALISDMSDTAVSSIYQSVAKSIDDAVK